MEYNASAKLIDLADFLKNWVAVLEPDDVCNSDKNSSFSEYINNKMNITNEIKDELESVCRPENLNLRLESDYNNIISEVPSDIQLETLELQKQELSMLALMKYKSQSYSRDQHWKHYHSNLESKENKQLAIIPDLILSVVYYRPIHKSRGIVIDLEFDVLGQQYLTELRDKLLCLNDSVPIGDFTSIPDTLFTQTTKEQYPSGFFFIENVFYNDFRQSNSVDYSRIIMDWANERPKTVKPMSCCLMNEVRFIDLKIRLGFPYVYLHQGDCEHIFMFTDIRLKQQDDCMYKDLYPVLTYKGRRNQYKCRCCKFNAAKWVVFKSELLPETPCFLCASCNRLLHYDDSSNLVVESAIIHPYTAALDVPAKDEI